MLKLNKEYKRVAVIGVGVSNTPLIKYLANLGVSVTAFDKQDAGRLGEVYVQLSELGIQLCLGVITSAALRVTALRVPYCHIHCVAAIT
jgi:UDP-N-acetylmuramoylalanine-D-glutamate ligase